MDTIIYTCITRGYDELVEIKTNYRAICFTDRDIVSNTWEIIRIDDSPKISRKIKICPHLFLPDHKLNVWIDGNVYHRNIDSFIAEKSGFWSMTHPRRTCAYQEAVHCINQKIDKEEVIMKQIERYYKQGFPFDMGLTCNAVLLRDNSDLNKRFANLWWREVDRYSGRDQISFNYVAWKLKFDYKTFPFLQGFKKNKHIIRKCV